MDNIANGKSIRLQHIEMLKLNDHLIHLQQAVNHIFMSLILCYVPEIPDIYYLTSWNQFQ